MQDGINSAIRYVKNNFLDGPRQDAYDLVTGTWVPFKGGGADEAGWMSDRRDLAVRAVRLLALFLLRAAALEDRVLMQAWMWIWNRSQAPYVLLASFCSIFTALFASSLVNGAVLLFIRRFRFGPLIPPAAARADYIASPTKVVIFSFVVAGFSAHSILTNGIDYVAHPRLSRKAFDEVVNYSGKGFECVPSLLLSPRSSSADLECLGEREGRVATVVRSRRRWSALSTRPKSGRRSASRRRSCRASRPRRRRSSRSEGRRTALREPGCLHRAHV